MIRSVLKYPDPRLRVHAAEVTVFDESVLQVARDLVDTMRSHERCVGLAAPQIGVGLRAFSYNVDGSIGYVLNPELVELSEEKHEVMEGCLSLPGLSFTTVRAQRCISKK